MLVTYWGLGMSKVSKGEDVKNEGVGAVINGVGGQIPLVIIYINPHQNYCYVLWGNC